MIEITEPLYDVVGRQYELLNPTTNEQQYVGKKYNHLTCLSPVKILDNSLNAQNNIWLFQCDCGEKVCYYFNSVVYQGTADCGHTRAQKFAEKYIGKHYNLLTIIGVNRSYKRLHNIKSNNSYYDCRCDCGNIMTARITSIVHGEIKSCGCLKTQQEKLNLKHGITLIDLTGQQFGKLTVLKRDIDHPDHKDPRWICQCKCGKIKTVRGSSLREGTTNSCGCLKFSLGEAKIAQILNDNHINYIYDEVYFQDLTTDNGTNCRYDFIILDDNNNPIRLIEFQGEQHYKSSPFFGNLQQRQNNDKIKLNYAIQHNLPLLIIPYNKIKDITYETLFDNTFLVN